MTMVVMMSEARTTGGYDSECEAEWRPGFGHVNRTLVCEDGGEGRVVAGLWAATEMGVMVGIAWVKMRSQRGVAPCPRLQLLHAMSSQFCATVPAC